MKINDAKQMCAPAAKPRLALPTPAIVAAAGVVGTWTGATVQKHAAFGTRTGLHAWSPPTC